MYDTAFVTTVFVAPLVTLYALFPEIPHVPATTTQFGPMVTAESVRVNESAAFVVDADSRLASYQTFSAEPKLVGDQLETSVAREE